VAPLQPPTEPDDQSPNQVTPGSTPLRPSLRRERSARHFAPEPRVSPKASPRQVAPDDPGSLLRASSLRRERSERRLDLPPRVSQRVSPRVAPLGAGESLGREQSLRGPPRRAAPDGGYGPPRRAAPDDPEPPPGSLRRERSSRML
jgi:hypothetical protein